MVLKMAFIEFAGSLVRTVISFAATAPAVKVLYEKLLYIDAGSCPPFSSNMTRVVMVVMLTFWVLVPVMSIDGRIEYRLAPDVGTATSMKGGVPLVTTILKVPSAAVVPVAVLPLLSWTVTVAPASGSPVATVPVIV